METQGTETQGTVLCVANIYPMQTNSTYSANGDRLLSVTDSLRNTATYGYSSTNSETQGTVLCVDGETQKQEKTGDAPLSYDRYDRVTGIKYNDVQKFGYEYNADGLVSRHTDSVNGKTYNYTYDLLGRLQRTDISGGSSIVYKFDNVNNVTETSYKFNGVTKTTKYPSYFKGGVVQNATFPNGAVKTRSLNGQAQVRPSTLTTPTGKKGNRETQGTVLWGNTGDGSMCCEYLPDADKQHLFCKR